MNSKNIIFDTLSQLRGLFISQRAKEVIEQTQILLENTLNSHHITELFLNCMTEILETQNYADFFDTIESSCKLLWIKHIYFDFPKKDIGTHFHNPKINSFLQSIHQLEWQYSHIIFNQPPSQRNLLQNVGFMSEVIHIHLQQQTYKNISELLEKNPHISFEDLDQLDIKYQRDNSVILSIQDAIWVATFCFDETNIAARNKYAQWFLEKIVQHIQTLWEKYALKDKAYKDALSWLFNRWYIDEAIKDFKNAQIPLAFFSFDVDGFKSINDTYWHDAWDIMIVEFAKVLESLVEKYNQIYHFHGTHAIAARNWGDEFQIIFPYCDEKIAQQICEEVIQNIHALSINHKWNILQISTCIWVALWKGKNKNYNFVKKSDSALYDRKSVKNDPTQLKYLIVHDEKKEPTA